MQVKILGSAAGGGFPQWNCGCSNCRRLRLGTFRGSRRSQSQLAISGDGKSWFLLGASPDLRYQIESCQALQPSGPGRSSPIAGVVLTGADLDHTLGLLLLREWHRFTIHSTSAVHRLLVEENLTFQLLRRMPDQITWLEHAHDAPFALDPAIGARLLSLPGHLPSYAAHRTDLPDEEAVSGLILESPSGSRMAYFPGLPAIDAALLHELAQCRVILVDGTFWTNDELVRTEGFGSPALAIGHLPVSGENGSLAAFRDLSQVRRIYTHINNTNPMLDEDSSEHQQIRDSGWELAFDGMEFTL